MNKLVKYIVEQKFNFNIDQLDIEDNGEEFSLSKQQYKPKSMKQEYVSNSDLLIDLGLPSGTLWCKYNLGVNPNRLNKFEYWYGEYYQWAQSFIKGFYHPDEYLYDLHPTFNRKYMNPDASKYKDRFNKTYSGLEHIYDRIEKVGYLDIDLEDDAAYQLSKKDTIKYCTPSRKQFVELIRNCSVENVYDYEGIDGLNGKLFTSKVNGKQIFFPFSGFKSYRECCCSGVSGFYWTSTESIETFYNGISFKIFEKKKDYLTSDVVLEANAPYNGFTIRPVVLI